MSSLHQELHSERLRCLQIEAIEMTVESDISELKTDIKWIKQSLEEIKKEKNLNKGYLIGIIGSTLIAISGLIVGLMK